MLSPHDTKRISDYFHHMGRQQRSTCGPQLEAMRLYAVRHHRSDDVVELRQQLHAMRIDPSTRRILRRGERDLAAEYELEREIEEAASETARPTRKEHPSAREAIDDETLAALGRTGRRLQRVRDVDPMAYDALEAICGDSGALWATSREGSIGALLIFTRAGRKLLAKSKRETPNLSLSDQERLLNAAADNSTKTSLLMDEARIQMRALLERACRRWDDTVDWSGVDWSDSDAEIARSLDVCRSAVAFKRLEMKKRRDLEVAREVLREFASAQTR